MADPFTLAEQHIIKGLLGSKAVSAIVKAKNVIVLNDKNDTRSEVQSENEVPDLLALTSNMVPTLSYASNAVGVKATHSLDVNSGSWNIEEVFYPLQFALIAAFADMLFNNDLQTVLWEGKKFITDVDLLPAEIGISDQVVNRGIEGWSAVFSFTTDMVFTRQDLIDFNQGV